MRKREINLSGELTLAELPCTIAERDSEEICQAAHVLNWLVCTMPMRSMALYAMPPYGAGSTTQAMPLVACAAPYASPHFRL